MYKCILITVFIGSILLSSAQNPSYNKDQIDFLNKSGNISDRNLAAIMDSIYFYSYNTQTGDWELKQKLDDYNYNGGLQNSYVKYLYEDNKWKPSISTTIIYSANNDRDTTIEKTWNGYTWMNYKMIDEDFDDNHNQTRQLTSQWINSEWSDETETLYTYNSNGNLLTQIFRISLAGNGLQNDSRTINVYNNDGQKRIETYDKWQNGVWVPTSRFTYSYNSNGLRDTMFFEKFNYDFWQYDWLIAYSYNSQNLVVTSLQRDYINYQWVDQLLHNYTYDGLGRQILLSGKKWANSQWIDDTRLEIAYDEYGNADYYFHTAWDGVQWNPLIKMHQNFDSDGFPVASSNLYYNQNMVSLGDSVHYYFQKKLSIEEKFVEAVRVFPNPGKGLFEIDAENEISLVEVYDSRGVRLKEINNPGKIIDITGLPKGIFILRISTVSEILFSKLVKY